MVSIDIRRISIILVVAILFSIFVFSLGNAFLPERAYPDFCTENNEKEFYRPHIPGEKAECPEMDLPTQEQLDACPGSLHPDWSSGCPTTYECSCYNVTSQFEDKESNIIFWIAIFLGFAGIIGGMLLPKKKNPLNEWVGSGFIIGGLLTIFIATMMHWDAIHDKLRPIVILLELILVLWVAYKKFGKK